MKGFLFLCSAAFALMPSAWCEPVILNLWPEKPPAETKEFPPEADQTKPEDPLIAGRRIIKLGNVSTPQLAVHQPEKDKANGAAIIVAPGGGFHILAYDLEGTEVADYLNLRGICAVVLKYRVPMRDPERPWLAAVQDTQRALSLVRNRAAEWGIDPQRIGILGFSAGGHAAAMAALLVERQYPTVDDADQAQSRPDFAVLIYPGGLLGKGATLRDDIKVTKQAPPMFLAHAHDDNVSSLNSALLYAALKTAGVSAELHIFAKGGHGYGLRGTDQPVTSWPARMEAWLNSEGWLKPRSDR